MKKKINRMLVLMALLGILLTAVLLTYLYYRMFESQVFLDLEDCAALLAEADFAQENALGENLGERGVRVTLVEESGLVRYDNLADPAQMENHLDRPEVADAFLTGAGRCVRESETLSSSTFYYALRRPDGSVLRVSKTAGSIYSVFRAALPGILLVLALLLGLSFCLARLLAAKLLRPVKRMAENMDAQAEPAQYEELAPFVSMIQKQHEDILKGVRMRQEFTANVTHELKTPLTSISGYAELIETGMADPGDTVRFARGIHSSADRLLSLINDIIRLSELDGGEAAVPFERLDLYELAGSCVETLSLNGKKHQVSLALRGESVLIDGNRQMIEELLYNLCDNAIRYNNRDGRVEVYVGPQEGGGAVLSVSDTGIGIPKEHQERIFERFYRVDKSRSKSTGGTGLGLAIVKHIVALHGARMELWSEVGRGTKITVYFP